MTTLTTTISQQEEIVTFIPEQEVTEQETIQVELTTTVQEEVFIGGAEEASIITILVVGGLMFPRDIKDYGERMFTYADLLPEGNQEESLQRVFRYGTDECYRLCKHY